MLKDYFRYRRPVVCFYCCVLLFFPLVCYLYRLPLTPVCYVLLIFSFLFLCWAVADGLRFRQRLLLLQQASACPSLYVQRLPEPTQPLEVRYQQMIEQLYRLLQQQTDTLNATHGQQVEYYTMWLHQIKTPIAAIRLSLQSGDCAPALLEQELFKIEQYVEMALQYVKIQQLANDLVLQEYDVEEIVRQSVKKYAPLFIYKKLSINITPMALRAPTDSKWLSFIIEQLLSNAIKYTNQGGVQIYASGRRLVIEDSGIGIRSEDLDRVFEKGYTGYNGRLDKRASGIGLYMAKQVAQALAIEIQLTSRVGKGTRVGLVFPETLTLEHVG